MEFNLKTDVSHLKEIHALQQVVTRLQTLHSLEFTVKNTT